MIVRQTYTFVNSLLILLDKTHVFEMGNYKTCYYVPTVYEDKSI